MELNTRKGVEQFSTDEHVRKGLKIEDLQKLKAVFKKDGSVTAGNASGLNDAGAAIVMMEAGARRRRRAPSRWRGWWPTPMPASSRS